MEPKGTKNQRKITRRSKKEAQREENEARWGQDGPRIDYVGQVVSTLGRSWEDTEVAGRMENGRGALVRAVKMGPKWVQEQSKMDQDEREGSISRP